MDDLFFSPGKTAVKDNIDSYFECISECSIVNGHQECVTRCIEIHLKGGIRNE